MKWLIFLTALVSFPNIQIQAIGPSSFWMMGGISSYCKDCMIITGTQVDSQGKVINKNYQFKLPNDKPLKLYVNLISANKRSLGFSKAKIKLWLVDRELNNTYLSYEFVNQNFKSSDWGFSFFFEIPDPGVYRIEILDPYDDYISSTLVTVAE